MKFPRSLNTRLVLSHLAVSLASIVLLAAYASRSIFQGAFAETEHSLQGLAVAAGNAIELPIQELQEGTIQPKYIHDLMVRLFADTPEMQFTIYLPDGSPLADSGNELSPRANLENAPEVIEALESGLGRATNVRQNTEGELMMHTAVLVQREIEVTAILRLSIPMQPTIDSARRSFGILLLVALAIASGVSLVGWRLAKNIAKPIQVLTKAAENMERGDLGVKVKPSGPEELILLAEAFNNMSNRIQSFVSELRAFVANASHELRTPLTAIKLRTEALREGALEEPDVAKRFLGEIDSEIDRLVRMVNDMLDLSRMEAGLENGQRSVLNLGTIAHEVYEIFCIRANRDEINLNLDIDAGLLPVKGNEDQLRRVFYNLVENAIKYTPSGGQVEILLRPGPNNSNVRLLVRDTGPGISSDHLPHVFERFYRAETLQQPRPGTARGSGLGLAIAKSIIESHGGKIGVSSQVGKGTTLWADLPCA